MGHLMVSLMHSCVTGCAVTSMLTMMMANDDSH